MSNVGEYLAQQPLLDQFFTDCVIRKILFHLRDELNQHGKKYNLLLVGGVRDYDAYNVPLTEFPLLKVFRLQDTFMDDTEKSYGSIRVSYCMSYPNQEHLMAIANQIGKVIHFLVNGLHTKIGVDTAPGNRNCVYRTITTGGGQTVISVVDYSFTIIEGSNELLY